MTPGRLLARLRRAIQRRRFLWIRARRVARRLPQIRAALRAAPPGFTLVVGDSHAEFLCAYPLGPRPVVNGGIGGIETGPCAARR